MKGFENMFLSFLKKKEQEDPNAIIKIATAEIYPVFKKMSSNEQGQVGGDRLLYYISQFAGITCLKAALSNSMQSLIVEGGNMQLMQMRTEMGVFYVGDQINRILFDGDQSLYSSVLRGAEKKVNIMIR